MRHQEVLPVLYDLSVTIGGEVRLKSLLTRTLQRLLYHTSFSAGFICLDLAPCDASRETQRVRMAAAVGDFDLITRIDQPIDLPCELVCGAAKHQMRLSENLHTLGVSHGKYRSYLRLPLENHGVVVLLAIEPPETQLDLSRILQPVLAQLARAIVLCRTYDAQQHAAQAERDTLQQSLSQIEDQFQTLMEISPMGVGLFSDGVIIDGNLAFMKLFGHGEVGELRGKPLADCMAPGQGEQVTRRTQPANGDGVMDETYEAEGLRKDGSRFPVLVSSRRIQTDRGERTFSYFIDITQQKLAQARIHQLAYFDPLTGLPNRQLLRDSLHAALATSARSQHHGAVLFLDLDDFKSLNDTKGPTVGDALLIEVGTRLTASVPVGSVVARPGGDEFIVMLENLSTDAHEAAARAELTAEKIHQALHAPFVLDTLTVQTTSSIGIVLFQGSAQTSDSLLQHADTAMYQAKSAGRNTIRFFDPQMQAELEARLGLMADLGQAVARDELRLYFQRQVNAGGRATSAEVLLRWAHPVRGLVSPGQFIPLAEETGIIIPVGQWVLQRACRQLKSWAGMPGLRDLVLAVNVSAWQFHQPNFVDEMRRELLQSGARPSHLKLELTESVVLKHVEETIAKMRELKLLGVSFSLDDFGTGYSSLQYLKRLPLDQIKIDQSFVRDITTDANDAAIVQTIVAMTEALGLNVIAEGVETEAQRAHLDRIGCHAFQGYLFGKPLPLDQFEADLGR